MILPKIFEKGGIHWGLYGGVDIKCALFIHMQPISGKLGRHFHMLMWTRVFCHKMAKSANPSTATFFFDNMVFVTF